MTYIYSVLKNEKENTLIEKNISSNQPFSNFFSENVTFTKFLPKISEMTVSQ